MKTPLKLKMAILNRLSKENPKYSSILRKASIELINLYEHGENPELLEKIGVILAKQGKICGNCNALINVGNGFEVMRPCKICNKIFYESCSEGEHSFLNCSFCNLEFCRTHSDDYDSIDLKNENLVLCDVCLKEQKYCDGQIICKTCQDEISPCSNEGCERKLCIDHQRVCDLCGKINCPDCAEHAFIDIWEEPGSCEQLNTVCKEYESNNIDKCVECGKILCSKCFNSDINQCFHCGATMCNDCSLQCIKICSVYRGEVFGFSYNCKCGANYSCSALMNVIRRIVN